MNLRTLCGLGEAWNRGLLESEVFFKKKIEMELWEGVETGAGGYIHQAEFH